ncbi:MAG: HEPN domain-containing protein [Candidatus Electrothrix sp. MAN1_4]|nr:HEPN domain-containing protein [Candidatus Electrothrix sp. MAN1_4]
MKLITQEWLDRAKDDLAVIEEIIDNESLTNMSIFLHAQQAVEKTLKAVIEEYEIAFVRTHKLEFLLEKTKEHLNFPVDIQSIRRLDEVYTEARYPSDLGLLPYGKPSAEDAQTMLEFARNLYDNVESLLQ